MTSRDIVYVWLLSQAFKNKAWTRPYVAYEKSFYFAVFAGDNLRAVDRESPICSSQWMSPNRHQCCQSAENGAAIKFCNQTFYSSRLSVSDAKTGLRTVNVTSPGSMINISDFVIGSASQKEFRIWTDCCHHGVEVRARDVAGNEAKCVIGINPNTAVPTTVTIPAIVIALSMLVKQHRMNPIEI